MEHSQLKLPGVLTQEAREPHPLFGPAHSLLSDPDWTNVHGRQRHNGISSSPECYIPIQAVWCCVNPVGHLQVKPPIVLTQLNWQLCCLVEHSSTSEDRNGISSEALG